MSTGQGWEWGHAEQAHGCQPIDMVRMQSYRQQRLRDALQYHGAALCILVSPVSLRYAVNYRNYSLFQSHIPTTYLFVPVAGPIVMHGAYDPDYKGQMRPARALSFYDAKDSLQDEADKLAADVIRFLSELGTDNRRVAVEYVNPSLTLALKRRGLEVIDGVLISEAARTIKSDDEIACIRHAVAVAEHGIRQLKQAIKPAVSELQLWGMLNYVNIANDGDWHEGRMLSSGSRINPWLQEASPRLLESGDLVGFDTDMVGPFGYFADVSRTMHCGPASPTRRQRELYQFAVAEIEHNLKLVRPGIGLREFQRLAWPTPEEFQQNAYSCILHGVGMCDEYPQIKPLHRGENLYDGKLEAGMVLCIESYIGAVGERDGVKLEQQVLVTQDGYEMLTQYPLEEELLV